MALTVGVVDLGDDRPQRAVGIVTPEQAQRVEHVAEHPGLQQCGDAAAGQRYPVLGQERVDPVAQRVVRASGEVVAGVEPGERTQRSRQRRQVVDVDVPAVSAVVEPVLHRCAPDMRDAGPVDRRGAGGHPDTTIRSRSWSRCRRLAARSPDAAPSSWNPQPWYAPANTTRSSSSVGSSRCAATDSGV